MAPIYKVYVHDYFGDARDVLPSGLKSFFVIRHGETDWNAQSLAQGQTDVDLNENGERQALAAQAIIKALGLKNLVSSPLKRARRTAELAVAGLNKPLPITIDHRLKERSFGDWEGKEAPSLDMYFGNYVSCENTQTFARRVAEALGYAREEGTLFSIHGCVNRTIMGLLGVYPKDDTFFGNAQVLYYRNTSTGWEVHNLSKQAITSVTAIELLDAKGRPVLEAKITTSGGAVGEAAAATGSTVGGHEPYLLTDRDPSRYGGKGLMQTCNNTNWTIADALNGMNVFDQEGIDEKLRKLDPTHEFRNLGGGAAGSVSQAAFCAAAKAMKVPLYEFVANGVVPSVHRPIFNVINGNRSGDCQDIFYEYMVVPHGVETIAEAVRMGVEVRLALPRAWEIIVGTKPTEGAAFGYKAHSANPADVLTLMMEAIKLAGFEGKACLAVDCAAVDVYDADTDTYPWMGQRVTAKQLVDNIKPLTEQFPILFIEDLLQENDFKGHAYARKVLPRTNIIGDDLTVSDHQRLTMACEEGAIDGFILKLNQSGTVTDALKALEFAANNNLFVISSLRSGGTLNDPTTDFSIGFDAVLMQKTGSPASADRTLPLNKMLRFGTANPNATLRSIEHIIKFDNA